MKNLTLEEKALLLTGQGPWHTNSCNGKLPSIMMTDGPHGLRKQVSDQIGQNNDSKPATCFPTASAIACSWNTDTANTLGNTIAKEALAEQIAIVLGPGTNIKRSPLCGRNFEYFSEDPYLSGCMATAYINGVQSTGVGTSLKHFAGNSQETNRQTSNSQIDERALHEIYLAAFKMAVKKAKPLTVMGSYNKLCGTYACQNSTLLTDILRKDWGYDGVVISDWGASTDLSKCIAAGMDLEMPDSNGFHTAKLLDDVQNGNLSKERFEDAVRRVYTLIQKQSKLLNQTPPCTTDYIKHDEIARDLECDSAVLLKNDGLLPIKPGREVLIIGDLAEQMRFQGGGSSHIHPTKVTSAIDAFKNAGLKVHYKKGYDRNTDQISQTLELEAVIAANKQIPVLFFGGLPDRYEGEGYDRTTLSIPDNQIHLLHRIYKVNQAIVFVSFSGSVIDFSFESDTKSILQMYLGGQAVGQACADLITGKVNPSGKLAETFPMELTDVPCYAYFGKKSDDVEYRESLFVGYRYYDTYQKKVRYPFGYGLSYTTFTYSNMRLSAETFDTIHTTITDSDSSTAQNQTLTVTLTVTNTGKVAGKEVVQIYVANPSCNYLRANKELRGFAKVMLQPNESRDITIQLDAESFCIYDEISHKFIVPSGIYEIQACASVADIRLTKNVTVLGTDYQRNDRIKLKEYFDQKDLTISREQFAILYQKPLSNLDHLKRGEYTVNNSLQQLAKKSLLGKIVLTVSKHVVYGMFPDKPHDDPEVMMFINGATEGTLDSTICQAGGRVPYKVAEAIVLSANRHYIKSLRKLLSKK